MTSTRFWGCEVQILFNELSLTGQFSDQDDFIRTAFLPFVGVLKEMQGFSVILLKKSNSWEKMITPTSTLYSFLVNDAFRKRDEVRRFKSAIVDLTKEPFWDSDSKQDTNIAYLFNGEDILGSSPAEACERDKVVVSFVLSPASSDPLNIIRDGKNVPLLNLTFSGKLTEHLWDNSQISFELYLKARFSGGKLDFSKIDANIDFSVVQTSDQSLFVDTFRKFEELTWDQIVRDNGLNYKEYHGNIGVRHQGLKTYKFRVSRKIRCHGYRDKDSFVVIGFEIDHRLSDHG